MLNAIEIREVFHFCFLEQLLKISDPKIYILKGGVNLRFFFKSPRYSEDMDIDVLAGSVETLKKNGFKILQDPALRRKLKTYGINDLLVNDPTKSKQTETTQRFRLRLVDQSGRELATKVEFSRRAKASPAYTTELARVDTELANKYRRLSFLVQHYDGSAALKQKFEALAGRKEVQARDAFDIFILELGGHANNFDPSSIDKDLALAALDALSSIGYKDYQTKVLDFLSRADREDYEGEARWQEIQTRVGAILGL